MGNKTTEKKPMAEQLKEVEAANNETPAIFPEAGESTPTKAPYVFQLELGEDDQVTLEVGQVKELNLGLVISAAMKMVYLSTKRMYDLSLEQDPDMSDEDKQTKMYDSVTYCIVMTQMLMYGVLEELFGKFDKTTLENTIKAANSNLDGFINEMMSKANKIQDKVVGELTKDKFGDHKPVVDGASLNKAK